MVPRSALLSCLASIAILAFVSPVASAAKAQGPVASAVAGTSTQLNRTQMSRAFSSKWSNYVQRVYGVPASVWVPRMAPSLAHADANNLRAALTRDTFEGAIAALNGVGAKLSDDKVITMLASDKAGTVTPQVLGSLSNDLVYTPVQPCRILDTRLAGGVIPAGTVRSFDAVSVPSFTYQGGSATDCGTGSLAATAIAVNITAVTPASAGFATAYPYNTTRPVSASINYAAGAIVNNGLIIQIPNPVQSNDFTIYTLATSDYVVDIVGYFAPPVATALDCVGAFPAVTVLPANTTTYYNAPACPAGYRAVTPYCWASQTPGVWSIGSGFNGNNPAGVTFCGWQNTTASPVNVYNGSMCCRVPGR